MSLRLAHNLVLAVTLCLAAMCVLFGRVLPPVFWGVVLVPWVSAWQAQCGRAWPTWAGSLVALAAFAYGALLLVERGLDNAMAAACACLLGIFAARLLTRTTPAHDLHSLVLSLLMVFAGTVLQQAFSYGLVLVAYTICVTWSLVTRQLVHGAAMEAYRTGDWRAHDLALVRRDVVTPKFFAATAGVALVILMCTGILFVIFPRVGLGGFGFGRGHGSRFPGNVSLAGPPRAQGDDTVVARLWQVSYTHFTRGLYLRGSIYDDAGNTGFSASDALLSIRPARLALAAPEADDAHPTPAGRVDYDVFLQPIGDQVMLSLGYVDSVASSPGTQALSFGVEHIGYGPSGELVSITPMTGAVRYQVHGTFSEVPPAILPEADADAVDAAAGVAGMREAAADTQAKKTAGHSTHLEFDDPRFVAHFLRLPDHIDPRVVPLAAQVVGDASTFAQKATRLRSYLMGQYTYSLVQTNGARPDPLASFLFDDKKGHCEYFATAFAVLLRAAGVPSRVVGGFQGGVWDPSGPTVIFTGAHAHAWVEWYQPHQGWVADDATPFRQAAELGGMAAWVERMRRIWDDEIIDFGLDQQLAMVRSVASALQPTSLEGRRAWSPGALPWRTGLGLCVVCAVAIALWLVVRRSKMSSPHTPARPDPIAMALMRALQRIGGAPVAPHVTLRIAAQQAALSIPPAQARLLLQALVAYEQGRFANAPLSRQDVVRWQKVLGKLRAR